VLNLFGKITTSMLNNKQSNYSSVAHPRPDRAALQMINIAAIQSRTTFTRLYIWSLHSLNTSIIYLVIYFTIIHQYSADLPLCFHFTSFYCFVLTDCDLLYFCCCLLFVLEFVVFRDHQGNMGCCYPFRSWSLESASALSSGWPPWSFPGRTFVKKVLLWGRFPARDHG